MPIFKPKAGPVLQWGRLLHFAEAVTLTSIGGAAWGYSGIAWTSVAVIGLGLAWELSNRWTRGWHQFADWLDWVAFIEGTVLAGLAWYFGG